MFAMFLIKMGSEIIHLATVPLRTWLDVKFN